MKPVIAPVFSLMAVFCTLLMACGTTCAQQPAPVGKPPSVTVSGLRNPVDKSYRKMLKGMDLFEKMHAMAPAATLRYKLLPRQPDADMQGITLKIVGDTMSIPVAVAPDNTFTLERNGKAIAEDAAVMPNRRADSMTWRTEIRTPGLLPDTRRLGDLRLECQAGMEAGLVSNDSPLIGALVNLIQGALDYCNAADPQYLFFSDRPLFGVTMRFGERTVMLSVDQLYAGISRIPMSASELKYCDCQVLLDRTYFLPLGDKSWPDDTLVQLEYMEDQSPPSPATPPATPPAAKKGEQ